MSCCGFLGLVVAAAMSPRIFSVASFADAVSWAGIGGCVAFAGLFVPGLVFVSLFAPEPVLVGLLASEPVATVLVAVASFAGLPAELPGRRRFR